MGVCSHIHYIDQSWSSLVEGGEGSYLPNCQTTLVIALDALSLLFCIFINTTAYHLGRHEPSPPSNKELHGSVDLYVLTTYGCRFEYHVGIKSTYFQLIFKL